MFDISLESLTTILKLEMTHGLYKTVKQCILILKILKTERVGESKLRSHNKNIW